MHGHAVHDNTLRVTNATNDHTYYVCRRSVLWDPYLRLRAQLQDLLRGDAEVNRTVLAEDAVPLLEGHAGARRELHHRPGALRHIVGIERSLAFAAPLTGEGHKGEQPARLLVGRFEEPRPLFVRQPLHPRVLQLALHD